jgi:hypothetical protein
MRLLFLFAFSTLFMTSCDRSKMSETSDQQFVGTWKLTGRSMLEGIEVQIKKNPDGTFKGTLATLNNNKYVQLFMSIGDEFVTGIQRHSNFQFEISEKKIAAPLFSAYGQSTSVTFNVEFKNKNEILLGNSGVDGRYIRVNHH